jgi:hypothetical protein
MNNQKMAKAISFVVTFEGETSIIYAPEDYKALESDVSEIVGM